MSEIEKYTEKMFEDIKHIDEVGGEYWSARELMPFLEYSKWERFSMLLIMQRRPVNKAVMMLMTIFPGSGKWYL